MEYPVEEILSYPLPALFVLAVFYGIYFAKMLAQKRRGIRTRQIGQRKEKSIHTVELLMSMATLGVVIAQLVTIAFGWSCLAANARFTGFVIGMLGDLIFLLSVLCMKDSLDLCQYFEHKKLKGYADFFNSSSSFCCGVI